MLQRFSFLVPIAGLLALAAVIAFLLPPDQRDPMIQEHGPIENGTVVLYLVAIGWLITSPRIERLFGCWSAAILVLCVARELDLQRAFTSDSITKSRYYLDPSIPLLERLVVVVLALLFALLIVGYLLRHWRRFAPALKARQPVAYSVASAVLLAPISKVVDGAHRTAEDLGGQPVSENVRMQLMAFEEILELGLPLLVLWAIMQFVLASRRHPAHEPRVGTTARRAHH